MLILPALVGHFVVLVLLSFSRERRRTTGCKVHLFDFLQNGEFNTRESDFPGPALSPLEYGRNVKLPAGKRDRRAEALLAALLNAHVDRAIV
ncbi:MAG: hypothetical protein CMJ81_08995 [Planctomycetaceae bacterium]|nr:hypothetical protein [Planctomycetaceae bacterium]